MFSSVKKLKQPMKAAEIRKSFIEYFTVQRDHKLIRSSPVVPFCDSSLAFVNAGMNQFKPVFLGTTPAPAPRVCNSQKCVRVGGKHNDLGVVGQDGYHHTFFEMLGNWSFGDYFKRDACAMALELLTQQYGIDSRRMYVTYFTGDKRLQLPADEETLDIWRSLGLPKEQVIGFGAEHNFWEMGSIGPCGPCTEIHLDNVPRRLNPQDAVKLLNKGFADLTELWNLVFIEFKRNEDGSITQLPMQHVDTGMGFERLTALLQSKSSNYDTDLFMPIIRGIENHCKSPAYSRSFGGNASQDLDTNYRIMADHMRMISVCLADGMLPDMNQKLRRVIRKVYAISEGIFKDEKLPFALIPIVTDSLGDAYPELKLNEGAIKDILEHELEVYHEIRSDSRVAFWAAFKEFPQLEGVDLVECPGFVPAYREFQMQKTAFRLSNNNCIPGHFLYKMHDTYGLNEHFFHKISYLDNIDLDMVGYREIVGMNKLHKRPTFSESEAIKHHEQLAEWTKTLPDTEFRFIYCHTFNQLRKEYQVPSLFSQIVSMMFKGEIIRKSNHEAMVLPIVPYDANVEEPCEPATEHNTIYVVTDASNFYVEAGGQQADRGHIEIVPLEKELAGDWRIILPVVDLQWINNCVVHVCQLPAQLKYVGDRPKPVGATMMVNGQITEEHTPARYFPTENTDDEMTEEDVGTIARISAHREHMLSKYKTLILKVGSDCRLVIDQERRKQNSCHHTAVHMLNGALRSLYKKVTFQVGSSVTKDLAKLEVGLIGKRIVKEDIIEIEGLLKNIIKSQTPVTLQKGNALTVMQCTDITKVPGEIYPENGLRIITIQAPRLDFISKELCCGTHVGNTMVLEDICIVNFKQTNRARFAFSLVARQKAQEAYKNMVPITAELDAIQAQLEADNFKNNPGKRLITIRQQLLQGDVLVPYLFKLDCLERIDSLVQKSKMFSRKNLNDFVDTEMRQILQDDRKFILHYMDSSVLMDEVPLQKATKLCKDRPILVIGNCDGVISARCCVPKQYQSEDFDADKWLRQVAKVIGASISAPKGQITSNVSLAKARKTPGVKLDEQLAHAIQCARQFAEKNL